MPCDSGVPRATYLAHFSSQPQLISWLTRSIIIISPTTCIWRSYVCSRATDSLFRRSQTVVFTKPSAIKRWQVRRDDARHCTATHYPVFKSSLKTFLFIQALTEHWSHLWLHLWSHDRMELYIFDYYYYYYLPKEVMFSSAVVSLCVCLCVSRVMQKNCSVDLHKIR